MNIVICLKAVPEARDVKIDRQTSTLVAEGVKKIINPLDTYALEEGVRLKERCGGKVTVISMGPPQAVNTLRETLSLGADEAVLLSDDAFAGADTWATAYTLAAAIKKLGQYDLVICGRQTLDGDTGQVGPQLAEMLGLPIITNVSQVEEITGGELRTRRLIDEGYAVIQASLPAVITVTKSINVPRLPSLRSILKSKSSVIPVWGLKELGIDGAKVGTTGSFTRVIKVFYPERVRQSTVFQGEITIQVDSLVDKLKSAGLV